MTQPPEPGTGPADTSPLRDLAYALGPPSAQARLRVQLEDFQVDEELGFAPDGEGEHVLLHVEKRNANTEWVARELARFAGVHPREVSYAGLKDRRAVTRQWFSLRLTGRPEPDWKAWASEDVRVLQHARHRRKLRRGALAANRFALVLRAFSGARDELESRLAVVARDGVPNYFGPQRFGHGGANLARAEAMLQGTLRVRERHQRGLYLSAARSHVFNRVLSARVAAGTWNRLLPGEAVMLDRSRSFFTAEAIDAELERRLAEGDVHPSGALWGRGQSPVAGEARAAEETALSGLEPLCEGLAAAGLEQERRALRLPVRGLHGSFEAADVLRLEFTLTAGAYATAVLRELVDVEAGEGAHGPE